MTEDQETRKQRLLKELAECRSLADADDEETAHERADAALLDYLNDDDIRAAFDAINKWYA